MLERLEQTVLRWQINARSGIRHLEIKPQRIAIARALIINPPILIFDEATSALDYESERIIQQNLSTILKGRTTLVIAHRLSTIMQMDRIIVIEKGRVTEQGKHDDLLALNGYYAELYRRQQSTEPDENA